MNIKRKSVSFWLFIICLGLISAAYVGLSIRLNTLDGQLVEYRHETQRRKYARAARFWVDYETKSREVAKKRSQ
jgi:hypothetical protein